MCWLGWAGLSHLSPCALCCPLLSRGPSSAHSGRCWWVQHKRHRSTRRASKGLLDLRAGLTSIRHTHSLLTVHSPSYPLVYCLGAKARRLKRRERFDSGIHESMFLSTRCLRCDALGVIELDLRFSRCPKHRVLAPRLVTRRYLSMAASTAATQGWAPS